MLWKKQNEGFADESQELLMTHALLAEANMQLAKLEKEKRTSDTPKFDTRHDINKEWCRSVLIVRYHGLMYRL